MNFDYLNKPEYLFQPGLILKKLFKTKSITLAKLPWGNSININPSENIGKAINDTSIYDLSVTEAITRICETGDSVLDVGANIGFTSLLMNFCVGKSGCVYSFEPHPHIFEKLKVNIALNNYSIKHLYKLALSSYKGEASLVIPEDFKTNEGICYVDKENKDGHHSIKIDLDTLDHIIPIDIKINLMKMDVEGHEIDVLKGASYFLKKQLILNILFEGNDNENKEVIDYLKSFGYTIYRLDKTILRLKLMTPGSKFKKPIWEPTNYLATLNPDQIKEKFQSLGYKCFSLK